MINTLNNPSSNLNYKMAYIEKLPRKKSGRKPSKYRKDHANVYNTTTWIKLRKSYLMEHPLCEECLKQGKTTVATQVHHIRHILEGKDEWEMKEIGFDSNNLEALCEKCHREKHKGKNSV